MKLEDLFEAKKEPSGSYAAVRFDQDTKDKIAKYLKDNDIPKGIAPDKLHTTLLYSHKYLPDYEAQGKIDPPWIGKPEKFDVWKSQPKEDGSTKNCLVLKYSCEKLEERHKFLMDEHDAQYDFPEYIPHITFSYDIGDMKVQDFADVAKALGEIKIVEEYGEDLRDDFADTATKKDE